MLLPNKLLQELRTMTKDAGLDIPLVEEVAADIFMGTFTRKFVEAAHRAAELLEGTLYATYYGIDYQTVRALPAVTPAAAFAELCTARANAEANRTRTVRNGRIIEQQQILTTQNLAPLFAALNLTDRLRDRLMDMAKQCFTFVCERQQRKILKYHSRLIMMKNTAYAWRQMIFYLSFLSAAELNEFQVWAESHVAEASESFRHRFRPAMLGLALAAGGRSLDTESAVAAGARRFLGWSQTHHWLPAEEGQK
jgi:hypothetical protein